MGGGRPGGGAPVRAGGARAGTRRAAGRAAGVLLRLPFVGQGLEAAGEFFELADGRAKARREHGVLGRVFGDGGDQQGDDRGERLA